MKVETLLPLGKVDPGLRATETPLDISRVGADARLVSADQMAAHSVETIIRGLIDGAADAHGGKVDVPTVMLLCGTAVAMAVSLFDWRSRSLDARGTGDYPHPLVRWTIISHAIQEALGWSRPLADEWREQNELAIRAINGRIGAAFMRECSYDQQAGRKVPSEVVPIAQLTRDEGSFGQSVLFEYCLRSVERGRRLDIMINMFDSRLASLIQMYAGNADQRWALQLERLHAIEQERRRTSEPTLPHQ